VRSALHLVTTEGGTITCTKLRRDDVQANIVTDILQTARRRLCGDPVVGILDRFNSLREEQE
jgi:hypothetical protein